ncbi:MAG TPA: hypothetical protein VGH28_10590 [Polyangiaceae bacterium]|jgi:hypothetical protein
MGSTLQWIEQVFRALILRNSAGADMPAEPALKIIGATLADDSANGQTVLTISPAATDAKPMADADVDYSAGTNNWSTEIAALTANRNELLPLAPFVGQLGVLSDDGSLNAHTITLNAGAANNIVGPDGFGGLVAAAHTYVVQKNAFPGGSLVFVRWTGTVWRVS